jgi:hypothetical protein
MGYNAGASAEIGSALVPSRHTERASGEAAAAAAASFSVLQASAPFSSTAARARPFRLPPPPPPLQPQSPRLCSSAPTAVDAEHQPTSAPQPAKVF